MLITVTVLVVAELQIHNQGLSYFSHCSDSTQIGAAQGGREGLSQGGQLAQTDQRQIPYTVSCSTIRTGRIKGGGSGDS